MFKLLPVFFFFKSCFALIFTNFFRVCSKLVTAKAVLKVFLPEMYICVCVYFEMHHCFG